MASLFRNSVRAFIDTNLKGNRYDNIPVISLNDYLNISEYQHPIIISPVYETDEIAKMLLKKGISFFWKLEEEPSEFIGYGTTDFEKFLPEPDSDKCIVIGSTFYAWWYYEKQKENGCKNVYLYTKNSIRRKYMEDELGCHFVDDIGTIDKKNCYVASREEFIKDLDLNGMNDIFDMSDMIDEYYNPEIIKFKNIHNGNIGVIIGNGPSLRMEDLEIIKKSNCVTFGTNGIYKIAHKFVPNYYFAANREFFTDESICKYNTVKFVNEQMLLKNEKGEMHYFHGVTTECGDVPFSANVSQKAYIGHTITYVAIQFAVYMGIKSIYLIGVDANYQKGKINHFYGTEIHDYKDRPVSIQLIQLKAYESAKRYADSHGIKIYNATRGGALEVFDRVDFDSLF